MDVYPIVAYSLPPDVFTGPLPSNGCPSIVGCALAGTCSPSNGFFWLHSLMCWANPSQYWSDLQVKLQNPTGWGIAIPQLQTLRLYRSGKAIYEPSRMLCNEQNYWRYLLEQNMCILKTWTELLRNLKKSAEYRMHVFRRSTQHTDIPRQHR
jgi:hypothetical protein